MTVSVVQCLLDLLPCCEATPWVQEVEQGSDAQVHTQDRIYQGHVTTEIRERVW